MASPSRSRQVEGKQTACVLSSSARAFRMTESREQTAIITAEMEKRKAVWLTVTSGTTRQRSSQKATRTMGSRKTLLSSSNTVHNAAHTRQIPVMHPAAMQAVRLGLRSLSHSEARHRKALGYSRA